MPHYAESMHLGQTVCTLCRQQAEGGSIILVSYQSQHTVQNCPSPCLRCSKRPNQPTLWCHKICRDILAYSYEPAQIPLDLENLDNAIKTLYTPSNERKRATASVMEGLFSDYTKYVMDGCFRQNLLKKMPAEILDMILEYIVPCPYLIVLGESRRLIERLRNKDGTRCERLNLTRTIYSTRINYQNISYISRLSNAPFSEETSPGESWTVPPNTHQIILSRDHMGIRNIQFLSKDSHPSEDGSPWYGIIEISASISDMRTEARHNGLFLQSFRLYLTNTRNKERIWSSPRPPKTQRIHRVGSPRYARLHHIPLDTGVKGLTVCCSSASNIGIHAYSNTSRDYEKFVARIQQRYGACYICWMFFPINAGESIRQIWIRCLGEEGAYDPIIVLQTTRYRTITFGPYVPLHMRHMYRFYPCVKKGEGVVSGICHNGLDPESEYISVIGVTCDPYRSIENTGLEISSSGHQATLNAPSNGTPGFTWYKTEAPLQDLSEVQVCQDKNQSHHPCIGLLLYYKTGSVEALGQIRWDLDISNRILAPIRIQQSTHAGKKYIGNVQQVLRFGCNMVEENGWHEIPNQGTIIWWFGHLGDDILIVDDK